MQNLRTESIISSERVRRVRMKAIIIKFAAKPELIARAKVELRGKTLGCWCAPKPCHGDVLLEIANERE